MCVVAPGCAAPAEEVRTSSSSTPTTSAMAISWAAVRRKIAGPSGARGELLRIEGTVAGTSPIIQEFRVRAVRVPMAEPHRTASGVVAESPLVLTDVVTDTGITGHSMVFTYTPAALEPTAELIRNFEMFVKGESLAPVEIEQKLAKRFRLLGTQGPGWYRHRRDRHGAVGCAGPRSQHAAREAARRGGEAAPFIRCGRV